MIQMLFNYLRLTWRLANDKRVSLWLKLFLGGVPLLYAAIPFPDDMLPVVGLLDEMVMLGLCAFVFVAASPTEIVEQHKQAIRGGTSAAAMGLDAHRCPDEARDLASGFGITFLLLILGGWYAGILGGLLFGLGYFTSRLMRARALSNAVQITPSQLPQLHQALEAALAHLPPVQVSLFVTENPTMNAFTFGYEEPYTIILTSALVERLTPEEIQAVIGHELGHIYFGHPRLTMLMAGASPLRWLFYKWSRSCEYSADAIALRASGGDVRPAISSLIKLASGLTKVPLNVESFLEQAEGESGTSTVAELGSTHPFMDKRIRKLLNYQQTHEQNEVYI